MEAMAPSPATVVNAIRGRRLRAQMVFTRDDDGAWHSRPNWDRTFTSIGRGDRIAVSFAVLLGHDPTLATLPPLRPGQEARRERTGAAWEVGLAWGGDEVGDNGVE